MTTTMLDPEVLWGALLDRLLPTIASPAQRQWLTATRPVGFDDDTLVLAAPHTFARNWVDGECGGRIRSTISGSAGRPITVVITVQPNPEPIRPPASGPTSSGAPINAAPSRHDTSVDQHMPGNDDVTPPTNGHDPTQAAASTKPVAPPASVTPPDERLASPARTPDEAGLDQAWSGSASRAAQGNTVDAPDHSPRVGPTVAPSNRTADETGGTQLNPKYVFDDFVIGASNRFAHAAARAVAEAPAKSYNPLFIYGEAGLGKTHLLHAIGHYVGSLYPRLRVRYVTTEEFTNEFINAIRDDRVPSFQRRYRQADVLLVDDIQFLETRERTQEEFFHTFNALHNAEKQIVMTSDRAPRKITRLHDRLRSRFEWGLITDVQPPDLETRIAILRKKATTDGLAVSSDVLEFIASKIDSNIRELEGALIRVAAFASLQHAPPDLPMAETVLKDLFPDGPGRHIGVQLIMEQVAEYFDLSTSELCSASRTRRLVQARQIAMYLVRELTELSLPKIGQAFGGKDHTTVMHANKKIAEQMQKRPEVYETVQTLTNRIKTESRSS